MSKLPTSHYAVGWLCIAAALTTPLAARAEPAPSSHEAADVEQARQHFGQGLRLYKEGDFDAALVQFERAYALKSNFKVLYNIAQCHFELHQYVEARDALARYLADGQGSVEAERKTAVENDLRDLQRRIAHVRLSTNVAGASVYIDGKKVGVTPLTTAIDVNEGQRTIAVEAPDRASKQRAVRLAGGEEQTVDIQFEAVNAQERPTTALAAKPPPPAATSPGLGAGFWLTGVGAVALGAGAGVTGYLALRAQADRHDAVKRPGVSAAELHDFENQAKTLALTTDLLAGGALVCAGVATVIVLTHDSSPRQVGIGAGIGNVTLQGTF